MAKKIIIKGKRDLKGRFRVSLQNKKFVYFDDIDCAINYAIQEFASIEVNEFGEYICLATQLKVKKLNEQRNSLHFYKYRIESDIYRCENVYCSKTFCVKGEDLICPICQGKLKLLQEVIEW